MIDWLVNYASEITNVGNGVWIAMSTLVSFYMFRLWRSTDVEIVRNFSLGVFMVAVSSGLHRLWWFLGIALAPPGQTYATWATDYRGALTMLVMTLAVGYSLHIKTALKEACGPLWWGRPLLAVVLGVTAGLGLSLYHPPV